MLARAKQPERQWTRSQYNWDSPKRSWTSALCGPVSLDRIRQHLNPIADTTPPLVRMNGFGFGLYGWLNDPALPAGHLKLYFITALWIPVIPLGAYAVDRDVNGFRFYGRMNLWGVVRTFRWRTLGLYLTALCEGALWVVMIVGLLALVAGLVRLIRA
jgi:hypothetical protein